MENDAGGFRFSRVQSGKKGDGYCSEKCISLKDGNAKSLMVYLHDHIVVEFE